MIDKHVGAAETTDGAWWLRGVPAAELPCGQRPEWAEFAESALSRAESALSRAESAPRVPTGELPGITGFAAVLAPFAELAGVRLPTALLDAVADLRAIRADFVRQLAGALARLAARTLVLELNVARVTGRLDGAAPSDRFRSFLLLAGRQDGLSALLGEYPVLARLLAQACRHGGSALAELLDRFAADRADIVATLLAGADPGRLVAVERTTGDGHRRGRSVAVLRFADGTRVVYKPRSLRVHGRFNELVGWFNARPGTPGLRVLALLERDGYGWVEFVAPGSCTAERQLERFYLRQGAWLALLYALDGTDLHFENLIACEDEPVLVDVETLFHPCVPADSQEDPAARALESSVYRSGLLPRLLLGDETAVDVSGLGGDAGRRSPVEGVDWAAGGTDEMRLVRRAGEITGAGNRPLLDGAEADPAGYTEALVAGFRAGYRAIEAGRDELVGPQGLLRGFAEDEVRVVARASLVYATLLDESTHPDVLRDAADRDEILSLLGTDALEASGWPALLDEEIAELWDGDIPLFTTRPGSSDLWSGTGRRLPGVLDRPGLDRVSDKIRAMGRTDRDEQEWIVRAAMAGRSTASAHGVGAPPGLPPRPARGSALDPARLLAAARGIGDQLVDRAKQSGTRINWLGLELLADRYWRVGPSGADLGAGYPGVALFLAQLAGLTGEARYAEVARRALRPLPRLLERLAEHPEELGVVGSGAFAGLGGIAYGLTQVSTTLDDAEIRSWIGPAVALTTAAARAEDASGVFDGTAGGLAALLSVHAATGSAEAWQGAQLCAARLADRPLPAAPGFGTGSAGIGWALLRFAAEGGGARYEQAGLAALRAAVGQDLDHSWCTGLPGIALAASDSAAGPTELVDSAVRVLALGDPLPNHSLCHGELGALELLTGTAEHSVGHTVRNRRAGALLETLDRSGPRCGTPGGLGTPGLLTGLAGIGHGLLRLAAPERTASALLQPPITPRSSSWTPWPQERNGRTP
ncbi:type 2 lanthipeptide synthetase LanM family protein [Kitasatospora sp. NPDC088779]|uniref:type 2 lanthipeptide synthetase LanM family protein n=1 Tax=Kitasatospora sp. NPDC088779 TaxID=3154964 RepID=UPI00343929C5